MAIVLYARMFVERENSISCETQLEHCRSMFRPEEQGKKTIEKVDNGYSICDSQGKENRSIVSVSARKTFDASPTCRERDGVCSDKYDILSMMWE